MVWIPYWERKRFFNVGITLDVYYIVRVVFELASAFKSLTSFVTSFLRCHKDIANLPGYIGHASPNPSKWNMKHWLKKQFSPRIVFFHFLKQKKSLPKNIPQKFKFGTFSQLGTPGYARCHYVGWCSVTMR